MALDPAKLSVDEIRRQYLQAAGPISPHALAKLRRDPRRGVRRIYQALARRRELEKEEQARLDAMLNFERLLWKSGIQRIAGVDEAGVGPLAGPVVAAAVVFAPGTELEGIDDSKRLDAERRLEAAAMIRDSAVGIGIGLAEVEEIDRLNIYHAAMLAMRRALDGLPAQAEHVLVDARTLPDLPVPQNAFAKGDGLNFSIAAASIIAKTHRDRLMEELDSRYSTYGFARHKGYGTPEHQEAIRRHGPCPIHRMSFTVLRELCGEYSELFYRLKRELDTARSPAALHAFEKRLRSICDELDEPEQRKLRLLLTRRWKAA